MTRTVRITSLLSGLAVIAVMLLHPALRMYDNWIASQAALGLVFGFALILSGVAWRTHWQDFSWLLALAMIAQGCALQLMFAPGYGIYQHYRPLNDIASSSRLACLVLTALYGLVIAWLYRKQAATDWQHLKTLFGPLRRLLLVLLLLYTCILVSADGLQYGFGVGLVVWNGLFGGINLLLAVRAIPAVSLDQIQDRVEHWLDGPGNAQRNRWLPRIVALLVVLISALIAGGVYEGIPHISDSIAYLFQAKYFSAGHLYLTPPPDAASFELSHLINDDGKWYAYGFPGWPAILALGVLAGVPWLVNPLLAGIVILLAHAWLRRLYGIRMAHGVVLLLAASPWFLYMSANFMAHTLGLTLALIALLTLELARTGAVLRWGGLTGTALGLLFLTRPMEGILMSLVAGLRILGIGGPRLPLRIVLTLALSGILVGGVIFPYNQLLTGDPLYPPQLKWTENNWYPGVDHLGFGPDIGNVNWPHQDPLPGHGLPDVVLNANKNFYATSFDLYGWSFGSLLFVMFAFLFGGWSRRDWLFWCTIFIFIAGHSLYWSPGGPDFGARYWYQAIIAYMVLTIVGAQRLANQIACNGTHGNAGTQLMAFIVLACITAYINIMPWRSMEKYRHYRGVNADVGELAVHEDFSDGALVFVRTNPGEDEEEYSSAFLFNPPTLNDSGSIYARYTTPQVQVELEALYPERPVWLIGRPVDSSHQVQVLQRPGANTISHTP